MGFFSSTELQQVKVEVDVDQLKPNCLKCKLKEQSEPLEISGGGKRRILIIGEYPSFDEKTYGTAFVGETAFYFKKLLQLNNIILQRDCWKVNAISCFTQTKPTHTQILCCYPKLKKLILELKPRAILLCGTIAITSLFGRDFSNRTVDRWRMHCIPDEKFNCNIIPIHHPESIRENERDINSKHQYKRDLIKAGVLLDREFPKKVNYESFVTPLTNFKKVKQLLKRILKRKTKIAYDYESTGLKPYRNGHKIVSIGIAVSPIKAFSFPFEHTNIWIKEELKTLKKLWIKILKDDEIDKIAHNCFSGDTEYITKNGIKTFQNTVNTTQYIWNKKGWEKATIKCFGKAALTELVLKPYNRSRTSIEHKILCTENHRWDITRQHQRFKNTSYWKIYTEMNTNQLKIKDKIFAEYPKYKINQNSEAFKHGLIFADGAYTSTKPKNGYTFQIRLCGEKEKFKKIFPKYTYPKSANGDPVINSYHSNIDFKLLPPQNSTSQYIAEFIEGWQLMDGTNSTNGESRIVTTVNYIQYQWLIKYASIGGWICSGKSKHLLNSGYPTNNKYLYKIVLTKQSDIAWTIKAITPNKINSKVYCAIVPNTERFTLNHGIATLNSKFEAIWSMKMFKSKPKCHFDTMMAAHILDNRSKYVKLKFQTFINFGVRPYDKSIKKFIQAKNGEFNTIEKAPLKDLLIYNGLDCIFTFMLYEKFLPALIKNRNLLKAYNFFIRGLGVMANIQHNGIPANRNYYEKTEVYLNNKIEKITKYLTSGREAKSFKKKYNRDIKITSNQDLGKLFYDVLGKSPVYTNKGQYKTDKATMESLNLPFVEKLLEMKKYEKARGTYLGQFFREIVDNKIHPFFDLHIPVSYRSSSGMPNFQNLPKRDPEIGNLIRKGIRPTKNHILIEADFGGAEVITSASYHNDPTFIYDVQHGDMHKDLATELWKLPESMLVANNYKTKKEKKKAKMVRFFAKNNWTFAQFYGDYFASCAKMLWENVIESGLELPTGQTVESWINDKGIYELGEFINGEVTPGSFLEHCKYVEKRMWEERFPLYSKWKKDIVNSYLEYGFIENHFGFRFKGFMSVNQCCNFPIQSCSFHLLVYTLIKFNMFLKRNKLKAKLIGQIHDSIIILCHEKDVFEVLTGLNNIVKGLQSKFKWLPIPMEMEYELSDKYKNGGNFSDMTEYNLKQIKQMYG